MLSFEMCYKDIILRQLENHSGATLLNDTTIVNVLHLLYWLRGTQPITFIDPLAIPRLFKQERIAQFIRRAIGPGSGAALVLLPLVRDNHWSLLVFVPPLRVYLHFDSLGAYHYGYAQRVREALDGGTRRYSELPFHREGTSQQEANWECGFFVLMNALMLINMRAESLACEESLRAYLRRHIPSVRESNIRRFADKVYDIVVAVSETKYIEATAVPTTVDGRRETLPSSIGAISMS